MRSTKILSLSLSPTLLREAEKVAKQERRTKSELFREALRRYIQERDWAQLQQYGAGQSKRLNIKESDIRALISEYRKSQ